MNRLTKKHKPIFESDNIKYDLVGQEDCLSEIDYIEIVKPAVDKCGLLENVEEELGIDLVTLFKALKNGIYVKKSISVREYKICKVYIYKIENSIYDYEKCFYAFEGIEYCFNWRDDIVETDEKYIRNKKSHPLYHRTFATNSYGKIKLYFEDYSKTWALTKEELLDE